MRITTSVLPILATVLASTRASASPMAVEDNDPMIQGSPTTITSEPPTTPMNYSVPEPTFVELEGPDGIFVEVDTDWIIGIAKHKGPKKHHHHKDKKKSECQHDCACPCRYVSLVTGSARDAGVLQEVGEKEKREDGNLDGLMG
ncbi:hypothetical protein F4860DRAFT_520073 [Xylaria cubensis]|nr:hypothetical protein F4860DRAFT_520073 [Xylaria cubensis]